MNAVGIDVSKGKSMIAIMRPLGEVVATPFEVGHTAAELNELAKFILKISGETRVVMEVFTSNPLPGHFTMLAFVFVLCMHNSFTIMVTTP